jgi:outer membrane lipoprotein SlyB
MQTVFEQTAPVGHGTRPLWWAIGVLGIAVVGMAGAMVYMRTSPPGALDAQTSQAFVGGQAPSATGNSGGNAASPAESNIAGTGKATTQPPPPVVAPAASVPPVRAPATAAPGVYRSAPSAPQSQPGVYGSNSAPSSPSQQGVYSSSPAPAQTGQPGVYGASPPPARAGQQGVYNSDPVKASDICSNCGTVLSVSTEQRAGATNGTGAVAGGVLGAVVGNQVGHGSGRAIATVIGAVGGGFAGNHVEKTMKQHTVHVLRLRMDDGSVRTVEQSRAVAVGSRVVLRGGVARLA